jgi:hypothetical protein
VCCVVEKNAQAAKPKRAAQASPERTPIAKKMAVSAPPTKKMPPASTFFAKKKTIVKKKT